MIVRQAKGQDTETLATIYLESRRKHSNWTDQKQFTLSDYQQATVAETVWVVEKNKEIVGFVSVYEPANFIHLLFIKPGNEGLGIGNLLLTKVLSSRQVSFSLKCLSHNQNALRFYQRAGFKITDEGQDPEEGHYFVLVKAEKG